MFKLLPFLDTSLVPLDFLNTSSWYISPWRNFNWYLSYLLTLLSLKSFNFFLSIVFYAEQRRQRAWRVEEVSGVMTVGRTSLYPSYRTLRSEARGLRVLTYQKRGGLKVVFKYSNRNRVRWAVLDLSQDEGWTDLFENFNLNSLCWDFSNITLSTHLIFNW